MLVNDTIASENNNTVSPLSADDVLAAIDSGRSEGGALGRHWVLDPIDGTKGYVMRYVLWSLMNTYISERALFTAYFIF